MNNFTFQIENEDGTIATIQFNSETWIDAFPKFLDVCRGAGYIIPDGTALYSPSASLENFGDRDFLLFDDDLVKFDGSEDSFFSEIEINTEHSETFYDSTRNR